MLFQLGNKCETLEKNNRNLFTSVIVVTSRKPTTLGKLRDFSQVVLAVC